jgi:hypothetical protein
METSLQNGNHFWKKFSESQCKNVIFCKKIFKKWLPFTFCHKKVSIYFLIVRVYNFLQFSLEKDVIGNAQRASNGDWKKICGIYRCGKCMGKVVRKRRKTTQGKRRKSGRSAGRRRKMRTKNVNVNKWLSRDSPTLLMATANANASVPIGEELPVPTSGTNSNSSSSSSAEINDEGDNNSNSAGDLPCENGK